jgi:hypothetical protein
MKLLIMQFSPISRHFSLRTKYSPQHPVLKHPQSVLRCVTRQILLDNICILGLDN